MSLTDLAVQGTDLVLRYGHTVALDESSFDIPAGSITAVIGPNGSGKSTLLNAIAGLMEPASGTLDVRTSNGTRSIAYVLQSTRVNQSLPVTVREVVAMGRYATLGPYGRLRDGDRRAVEIAMERVGVAGIASSHLDELSGGQRQRVFVAQGLAQDHAILLLDEPLTGIDLTTAQAIDDVIRDEVDGGSTVVMTTHDLSEAQAATHVVLVAGRVVASGTADEVLTRDHLVAAYGQSLLQMDDGGSVFLDDPTHAHMPGRHAHRGRTIHVEAMPDDVHPPAG